MTVPSVRDTDHIHLPPLWHRDQDSFSHAREISLPWGSLEGCLDWCRRQLQHDWRWQIADTSTQTRAGRYIFYFDSDSDVMIFSLKWC